MVMRTTTAQKNIAAKDGLDYPDLIGSVARHFWGEPNEQLSKPSELRFGCHGSKSVDLEKNQFFDHEAGEGGGVIKLVQYGTGIKERGAAHQWLVQNGFIGNDRANAPAGREVMQVMKSCPAAAEKAPAPKTSKAPAKIVATYGYRDEQGELLMQVVRMEPKTFRQRRPDGERWSWSVKDVRVVPYRLPELAAAPDAVVYLVEGERTQTALHPWAWWQPAMQVALASGARSIPSSCAAAMWSSCPTTMMQAVSTQGRPSRHCAASQPMFVWLNCPACRKREMCRTGWTRAAVSRRWRTC